MNENTKENLINRVYYDLNSPASYAGREIGTLAIPAHPRHQDRGQSSHTY